MQLTEQERTFISGRVAALEAGPGRRRSRRSSANPIPSRGAMEGVRPRHRRGRAGMRRLATRRRRLERRYRQDVCMSWSYWAAALFLALFAVLYPPFARLFVDRTRRRRRGGAVRPVPVFPARAGPHARARRHPGAGQPVRAQGRDPRRRRLSTGGSAHPTGAPSPAASPCCCRTPGLQRRCAPGSKHWSVAARARILRSRRGQ